MTLKYMLTRDGLTFVGSKGDPQSIASDHPAFKELQRILKEPGTTAANLEEVLNLEQDLISINFSSNTKLSDKLKAENGLLYFEDKPLPMGLSEQAQLYVQEGLRMSSLANFIENTMANPDYSVRYKLLSTELKNFVIDSDGMLTLYTATDDNGRIINGSNLSLKAGQAYRHIPGSDNEDRSIFYSVDAFKSGRHPYGQVWLVKVNPADITWEAEMGEGLMFKARKFTAKMEYENFYEQFPNCLGNPQAAWNSKTYLIRVKEDAHDAWEVIAGFESESAARRKFENTEAPYVSLYNRPASFELDYKIS